MDDYVLDQSDFLTWTADGAEDYSMHFGTDDLEQHGPFLVAAQDVSFTPSYIPPYDEMISQPSSNSGNLESDFTTSDGFEQPLHAQTRDSSDEFVGHEGFSFHDAANMPSHNAPSDYLGHNSAEESLTSVNAMFDMYVEPSSYVQESANEQIERPDSWITTPYIDVSEFVIPHAPVDAVPGREAGLDIQALELEMPDVPRETLSSAGNPSDMNPRVVGVPELNAAEADEPQSQAEAFHPTSAPNLLSLDTPINITRTPTSLVAPARTHEGDGKSQDQTAETFSSAKSARSSALDAPLKWITFGVEAFDGTGISYEDIIVASARHDVRSQVGKGRSALKLDHAAEFKGEWFGLTNKEILDKIHPNELTGKLILHLAKSMSNEAICDALNELLLQHGKKAVCTKLVMKRIKSARDCQEDPEAERERIHTERIKRGIPSHHKALSELAEMAQKRRDTMQGKTNTNIPSDSIRAGGIGSSKAGASPSPRKKIARSSSFSAPTAPIKKKRRTRKDILMGLTNFPDDDESTSNTKTAQHDEPVSQ